MKYLVRILRLIAREQRPALARGAALSLVVLLMGVALLGLSGWFITAAAAAGLAGAGAVFDVFRPSAMVRFLALGRTAARYGERLLTHDAVLRGLESLRLGLLRGVLRAPLDRMIRLRGAQVLNRLTADVDALDGLVLRLVLPVAAGALALLISFAVLWWLVDLAVAAWMLLGWLVGAGAVLWHMGRQAPAPSRRIEAATQAFRSRLIDLVQARDDLAIYGLLPRQQAQTLAAETRRLPLRRVLDRADRRAGAALMAVSALVSGGALWIGLRLAEAGRITPAAAAIGFFTALALFEAAAPLRRALSDLGRMTDAARRIAPALADPVPPPTSPERATARLICTDCAVTRPDSTAPILAGVSLAVGPGETLALTGPSGVGKSTLLLALAGLHPLAGGAITLGDRPLDQWSEVALRASLALLPQRSELLTGSVAENLRLAGPEASDDDLWAVLEAVQLAPLLRPRGGLDLRIGPRGQGLSGGERRRLALARVLVRRPAVLLLDEPTEGLDDATARAVLAGVRRTLPDAALVLASHRRAEVDFADRRLAL
ncbi:ATP-binding cassette subfamily C protein CydC [Paracoccus pantotrophus]|uniref:ATP-binding cassette subfamily C protein CydC n=2 Tax=Paracoccus pantotrophus TaxID=82367 RepID=A0A1I5NHE9_PARPN|nr:thiol reductant ABC exporter subunit CydC [Paracoccus pantotrophus]MDF3856512.1 thiol reductant ABC exporter subunit CydC [Paracoccus pantotrophus]QFG37757.1 thiol reductant ABC exporter subunit CydC [Paracoccus pantotrophus]QLH15316.1 thiol reductant ABC exporter subunit CydC [Paracoccus pantotrophus]RKS51779.1 ATP-binding cassette subfamily C protein CydC [Paracoccus pantotrophus]WGR65020.1 thiol reductant ABC exporter subunit CydC [Paracoccus pantotrophus]